MRVADSVRVTSVVQRLKESDMFSEADGDWEVTKNSEIVNDHAVKVFVRRLPDGKSSKAYIYDHGHRVTLIRK